MANTPQEVEHSALSESPDAAREWRAARFEEMGFSTNESRALANAKQSEYTGKGTDEEPKKEWRQPLDWKRVKAVLDAGCDPTTALDIFL